MNEVFGNAWELLKDFDAICVPTNGWLRKNGNGIMGAGMAKETLKLIPNAEQELGLILTTWGNIPAAIGRVNNKLVLTFPTKKHWKDKSDLALIKESYMGLVDVLNNCPNIKRILLPRPGCGMGGLDWETVKKELEPISHEGIFIVHFNK